MPMRRVCILPALPERKLFLRHDGSLAMPHALPRACRCAVTSDHVMTANGGFTFRSSVEFAAMLTRLLEDQSSRNKARTRKDASTYSITMPGHASSSASIKTSSPHNQPVPCTKLPKIEKDAVTLVSKLEKKREKI
jgi:hypothetical protein